MVEYGVNVANKFGFLSDDDGEDPEVMLKKAEAAGKKDEKTASQKKADKNAAARKKKETAAAAAVNAAAREVEAKKAAQPTGPKKTTDQANKENRPEGERGRGRGRGRGGLGRGRGGGFISDAPREKTDQVTDIIGDRFGENAPRGRGRGRGRGGPRPPFRGRGGQTHPFEGDHEHATDELNPVIVNGENNIEAVPPPFRGGYRGARGGGYRGGVGFRGGDGFRGTDENERPERPAFRGGRGGRGGRQFERLSGSDKAGVKPVDKKEGYGKGNWGTEQDELAAETEPLNTTKEEKPDEPPAPPREKTEEELRLEAEAEAISKQLTLDEFKAQLAAKRAEPQFNLRKAGEGSNEKEFGRLVPLTKESIHETPEEEIVIVRREPRAKRLDIEINFTDEQRGGRGGRGREFRGGRGIRGGRGEGRGPRQVQNFEVSADAFPALGAA